MNNLQLLQTPWYKLSYNERLLKRKLGYQETMKKINELRKVNLLQKIASKIK